MAVDNSSACGSIETACLNGMSLELRRPTSTLARSGIYRRIVFKTVVQASGSLMNSLIVLSSDRGLWARLTWYGYDQRCVPAPTSIGDALPPGKVTLAVALGGTTTTTSICSASIVHADSARP